MRDIRVQGPQSASHPGGEKRAEPGMISTDFVDGISDQPTKEMIAKRISEIAISPDAIARGILYALEQPSDVDVGSIVIRPTAQN